jgi:predicted pyridoxine 5'-phosphate oxidase superfamily flavin-nucleotide-binding protein
MSITNKIAEVVTQAEARALATNGPHDLNVVPISLAKVHEDTIWLFDFFMDKTVTNVKDQAEVALTAWSGFTGVQIKATAEYITEGPTFNEASAWVHEQNPDRVTKGVLVLTPTQIFDISPGGAFSEKELSF